MMLSNDSIARVHLQCPRCERIVHVSAHVATLPYRVACHGGGELRPRHAVTIMIGVST